MKWMSLVSAILIAGCSMKNNVPPEIYISLPFADNGTAFNGEIPSLDQISGQIHPGSEPFPSYIFPCASGNIREISSSKIIIEHSVKNFYFYSIYADIKALPLAAGSEVTERTLLGEYEKFFQFSLYCSPDFKQAESLSEISAYDSVPSTLVHIQRKIPEILIINPCMDPQKLSMVRPVKAILNEYTHFSVRSAHYLDTENLGNPDYIIVTGQSTPWEKYDLENFDFLKKILNKGEIPVLGICGGHQLFALLNGGSVDLVKPGSCPKTENYRGCYKIRGPVEVSFKKDPLFTGYSTPASFFASHCEHITILPEEFTAIAETSFSPCYAYRHKDLPIYGIQFHPELPANDNSRGRNILFNFIIFNR